MTSPLVVVGGGLTCAKAVERLRGSGSTEPIVVYGAETHLPYERPPLSKGYLTGGSPLADATVHDQGWYDEHDVELRLGVEVTRLDRERRVVETSDGHQPYGTVLLATGAAPRRLPLADDSGAPVCYLRTIEDSTRLKQSLDGRKRIIIVGGGWIGLEVAAAGRMAGCEVTVLESLELPLLRVLGPEVAQVFAALHREHGVDLRTEVRLAGFDGSGAEARLQLEDGSVLESDLVVVGVGVVPNTRLAEDAGLEVDNGVVVDEYLRTADPAVLAAGDVANAYHARLARRLRVEHWDNAIGQGELAAGTILGEHVAYDRLPYFFTDQYDLGMEYVGHVGAEGYDRVVVRGRPEDGVFTAFWMKDGRVLAGMHANDWDAIEPIRQIVDSGSVGDELADDTVPLDQVAATARRD